LLVEPAGTTSTAWSTAGTGIGVNAASGFVGSLLNLQVAAAIRFQVDGYGGTFTRGSGAAFYAQDGAGSSNIRIQEHTGIQVGSNHLIGWSPNTYIGTPDTTLYRDAANTLALRNATNAQTFRTYGTWTDASNYRRIALSMTTAGVATLLPEGAGTGASGNVLHISGLPTSNPGPGILWNNAGTPAIGT
jgi:hypothetical protein